MENVFETSESGGMDEILNIQDGTVCLIFRDFTEDISISFILSLQFNYHVLQVEKFEYEPFKAWMYEEDLPNPCRKITLPNNMEVLL